MLLKTTRLLNFEEWGRLRTHGLGNVEAEPSVLALSYYKDQRYKSSNMEIKKDLLSPRDRSAASRTAARVARQGACSSTNPDLHRKLCSRESWDAAVTCYTEAGCKPPSPSLTHRNFQHVIDPRHASVKQVRSVEEASNIPEGAFIGFFHDENTRNVFVLTHAMIGVGSERGVGYAAGNTNQCIDPDFGDPDVWQVLPLDMFNQEDGTFGFVHLKVFYSMNAFVPRTSNDVLKRRNGLIYKRRSRKKHKIASKAGRENIDPGTLKEVTVENDAGRCTKRVTSSFGSSDKRSKMRTNKGNGGAKKKPEFPTEFVPGTQASTDTQVNSVHSVPKSEGAVGVSGLQNTAKLSPVDYKLNHRKKSKENKRQSRDIICPVACVNAAISKHSNQSTEHKRPSRDFAFPTKMPSLSGGVCKTGALITKLFSAMPRPHGAEMRRPSDLLHPMPQGRVVGGKKKVRSFKPRVAGAA